MQGRNQGGGGRRGCDPLRLSGPSGRRSARAKTLVEAIEVTHGSHEICAETDKKHARAVGIPLTIWARQKTGPL